MRPTWPGGGGCGATLSNGMNSARSPCAVESPAVSTPFAGRPHLLIASPLRPPGGDARAGIKLASKRSTKKESKDAELIGKLGSKGHSEGSEGVWLSLSLPRGS